MGSFRRRAVCRSIDRARCGHWKTQSIEPDGAATSRRLRRERRPRERSANFRLDGETAIRERLCVGKGFLRSSASVGRCGRVFDLLVRLTLPLAIMASAKAGPDRQHALEALRRYWVFLSSGFDRLSHYFMSALPNVIDPARWRLNRSLRDKRLAIALTAGHDRPHHSGVLVRERDRSNFRRASR